ncbi:LysM peptidoglycan-binding domain-containing protein [Candidatus Villigracilis saccharophilus]|uniref:SdrD B-like domain and LysM peptidoglycan-binding domain-containing protein n=1 Tax=Candidatus Villigracilis saccharophilus TaxID=3140684 RepID=UPI0031373CBD|nr:LysM peptidoglycan-binding domain-containing protein [Anaerolineales bacterium]
MNSKRFFLLLILAGLFLLGLWLPAGAAPQMQQPPTLTPGADGRTIYIVQAGDNCTRVAFLNGISVDQLRQLNSKLDENCTLIEGQELLVGIIAVVETPTALVSPTVSPFTATPTPLIGTTEVCILLFNDANGNALREETEPAVAGGAVSLTENNGEYSAQLDTVIPADPTVYQGICFSNIPEGKYTISMAAPDNYNPTMELEYVLDVKAGDRAFVDFGIQSKDIVVDTSNQEPESTTTTSGSSPLFGIIGGLLLLGGVGLGYYAWRSGRPETKLSGGILKK